MSLLLLILCPAQAWEHTYKAFAEEDLPVEFWLAGEPEESVPEGYVEEAFELAAAQWRDATCGGLDAQLVGNLYEATGFTRDGVHTLSFNDPEHELSGGVLSATLVWPTEELLFELDGRSYRRALDADIVFNNDVDFGTEEEVESPDCEGTYSLVGELVHALGHAYGMDHSCDEADYCNSEDWLEASMYWTQSACSTEVSTVEEDDLQGAMRLTGSQPVVDCEYPPELNTDTTPPHARTIRCEPGGRHPEWITGVEWHTGNGDVATERTLTYTWEEPGQYPVEACMTLDDPWCGPSERCQIVAQVTVCPVFEAAMEVVPLSETMVHLVNLTPLSYWECLPTQWWLVTDSADEVVYSSWAWSPVVELPAGTYTATLVFEFVPDEDYRTVSETFTVPFELEPEGGCSTTGTAAPWVVLVALVGRRRRQRDA